MCCFYIWLGSSKTYGIMPCHGVFGTFEEYWKILTYFEQQYAVSRHVRNIYLLLAGVFT
jgi:hypothetical protein